MINVSSRAGHAGVCLARRLLIVISITAAYTALAIASEEPLFQSSDKQTNLIELYTAEGCSSCPSAEEWLSKLGTQPGLWKDFVPLAFHVDYWDARGWKDRFASAAFTQRQRAYTAAWNSGSAYTPAFAVNGRESRSPRLPAATNVSAGTLRIAREGGNRFAFTYSPVSKSESQWDLHVALLGSGIVSKVAGGENAGRQLRHDFVVLKYDRLRMTSSAGLARAETILSPSEGAPRGALAAWVTLRDRMIPVQATGGWLRREEHKDEE
jgi:hypothetical protein